MGLIILNYKTESRASLSFNFSMFSLQICRPCFIWFRFPFVKPWYSNISFVLKAEHWKIRGLLNISWHLFIGQGPGFLLFAGKRFISRQYIECWEYWYCYYSYSSSFVTFLPHPIPLPAGRGGGVLYVCMYASQKNRKCCSSPQELEKAAQRAAIFLVLPER